MRKSYLFALSLSSVLSATAFGQNACPQDHCSKISERMNKFCVENGMAGKPFVVFGPDGSECTCPCSCVTPDTLISTTAAPFVEDFESIKAGDGVESPFSSKRANTIDTRLESDVSATGATVRVLTFSNGSIITVSPEHTFVSPGRKVRSADELKVGDSVLDANQQSVQIVSNEEQKDYRGKLVNVIINGKSKKAKNHFVVTNGVISGDWLVQSNYASFKSDIDVRLGKIKTFR